MSTAVRGPVPRSRDSSVEGRTAVGKGSIARAPSWFDSWKATRSTRAEGCTSVTCSKRANGVHACSVTTLGFHTFGLVVVVGGRVTRVVAGVAAVGAGVVVTSGGAVAVVVDDDGAAVEVVVVAATDRTAWGTDAPVHAWVTSARVTAVPAAQFRERAIAR